MILEFKCKNYRSIKDEIVFSMLASSDETNEDLATINYSGRKILKKAIVYGANGSGKTNFLKAIWFLTALVRQSHIHTPSQHILFQPHKLSLEEDTSFSIQFVDRKGVRFAYYVAFNDRFVSSESLYNYPNGRPSKIFSREGLSITAPSYRKEFSFVETQLLKENRLFLSCAANYSNVPEIIDAYTFFAEDLVFYPGDYEILPNNWREYSARTAQDNENLRKSFVRFLKDLGSNHLTGLSSSVRPVENPAAAIPPFLNEEAKKQLLQQQMIQLDVSFIYDKFPVELQNESLGNQRLFEMFFPLVDVLAKGKVFLCDEFERSLHPLVVQKLIEAVSKNTTGAQFVLTTHDVGLLSPSLFRRDEVWFTEMKEEERSTDLYSLAELKAIRKDEIFSRNYILGKYSSIPVISSDLETLLLGGDNRG